MIFEEALVEHCSPTLAGVKPASMFRYMVDDKTQKEALARIRYWRQSLDPYGLGIFILKYYPKSKAYLVYVYRKKQLESLLTDENVCKFMDQQDYSRCKSCESYLKQLRKRIACQPDFPHEVGIFLGYPLGDVKGFIEHKGKNYTCSGAWKSYGEARAAEKTFAKLSLCKLIYKQLFNDGRQLSQLIVAGK